MKKIVRKLLFRLANKELDISVPTTYIVVHLFELALQLARAALTFGLARNSSRLFFRGQSVKLKCRSKIHINKGVRIGRGCTLDGLGKIGIKLGRFCKISEYSVLICSGTLKNLGNYIVLEDNVSIGEFCRLGGSGGVVIKRNTIIGQYFSAHPENHNYSEKNELIKNQGTTRGKIVIGENCWIGARVTVLAGTEVGHSSVIAAGAVVSGVFPPFSVIGGIPAKLIKSY